MKTRSGASPRHNAVGENISPFAVDDSLRDLVMALPKKLLLNQLLVAIADGSAVTVQTIRKPAGLGVGSAAVTKKQIALELARRTVELQVIVSELLRDLAAPAAPRSAGVLTDAEEKVLSRGGFDIRPIARAEEDSVLRTAVEYARMIQDSFTAEEAAAALGVNNSRIRQRVAGKPRTLYGIKRGNEWRIPKFQFSGKKLVPGIESVIARLPLDLHPVAISRWFTTPHPDLHPGDSDARRVSPIEWLRMGSPPDAAAELAALL